MTTRYTPLYSAIAALEANHQKPDFVDAKPGFPFKQIYQGQQAILDKVKDKESFCLTSHTGFGKTPVFLSLIRDGPAIVIEPRKFLQTQVSKYYNDFVLFGRSGYTCPLAPNYNGSKTAAMAPCLLKEDCSGTSFKKDCEKARKGQCNDKCKVFPVYSQKSSICDFDELGKCGESNGHKMSYDDCMDSDAPCGFSNQTECERAHFSVIGTSYRIYPCERCQYMQAVLDAQHTLSAGGTVICNFGNFWNLLKSAKSVVVDEADLFFREISAPMKLKYSVPKKDASLDIKALLTKEVKGLTDAVEELSARQKYAAQNLLYSAKFLLLHHDLCFMYQRKDSFYIEIDPRNTNILQQKLFKDKRVIIVSATPGSFDLPSYSASIHQRCGIYFAPVGNLTSRSLKANPYLMSTAAKAIAEISTYMELVYDADKVIVFCGNLGTHAASLYTILGERDCVLHQSGKLAESLEAYKQSGKKYFLVAGAEYGLDADWCKLQFLLKHPFPNLDERARTLQRTMGPEFNTYYENEARRRVIQTFGRNVRGFDDFGITICLDSKTNDDYVKNRNLYPEWVRDRIDTKVY